MQASTKGSPSYPGYGYLWWLWGDDRYAANGIFGQLIWIDPGTDLVIVTQSAAPAATSPRQSAASERVGRRRAALRRGDGLRPAAPDKHDESTIKRAIA